MTQDYSQELDQDACSYPDTGKDCNGNCAEVGACNIGLSGDCTFPAANKNCDGNCVDYSGAVLEYTEDDCITCMAGFGTSQNQGGCCIDSERTCIDGQGTEIQDVSNDAKCPSNRDINLVVSGSCPAGSNCYTDEIGFFLSCGASTSSDTLEVVLQAFGSRYASIVDG